MKRLVVFMLFAGILTSFQARDLRPSVRIEPVTAKAFKSALLVAPSDGKFPQFIGFSRDRAYLERTNQGDEPKGVTVQWTYLADLDPKFVQDLEKRRLKKLEEPVPAPKRPD